MFCVKCGNEIREGEARCSKCGAVPGSLSQGGSVRLPRGRSGKPKYKILIPAIAAAVVLLAAIAVVCHLNSELYLYESAVACLEERDYEQAEKLFLRLEDYENSGILLDECRYQHALACLENGEYDRALELIRLYEESGRTITLCKERIADAYRDSGSYEEAAGLYQELGKIWEMAETYAAMGSYAQAIELTEDYKCSGAQRETRGLWYRSQAVLCAGAGDYENTWKYLKEYKGGYDEELRQCAYQTARSFYDNGKYEEAVTISEKLKNDMEEAERLLNACYEAWGNAYAGEENYAAAWECFRKCQVTETGYPGLYATGQYYMSQGLYSEAQTIWNVLGDYQDSAQQKAECCRRQGQELEQVGEYSSAIAMYEECGDESLVTACIYNWAANAHAQGNYELAIEKYTELGDYQDSAQMIAKCRYDWGRSAYTRGDYELALRIFTELGSYEDSAEMIAQVQEAVQRKAIEDEKKARREVLEGTWKTESGDIRIEVSIPRPNVAGGGVLSFNMPAKTSSVTTSAGTFYGTTMDCKLSDKTFAGANQQVMHYGDVVFRGYSWDSWDYENGILYLRSQAGGWSTFTCTLSGNTMTLVMEERTFKLTRQ